MNSFGNHHLAATDDGKDNFGAKTENIVSAFDAFPKSRPQYITKTADGGKWTVAMAIISLVLIWSEASRWWRGWETHTFAVEKGVGHTMQLNLDVVVPMRCPDLHINVQDAAGDRILAAVRLQRDPTVWTQWVDARGVHRLGRDAKGRVVTGADHQHHDEGFGEEHVHDIVAARHHRARFAATPRLPWGAGVGDSCRIFGSLELNKVQGDFHITARGHGYMEAAGHLDHNAFNFSHVISELSFGPFYPSLVNPLDGTVNTAEDHFHKFQYYLSVVPTVYTTGWATMLTNQYAVTEQSRAVPESQVPGIFVKYDIEPILLAIQESRPGLLMFFVKIVNILGGVLVAGHWGYTLSGWAAELRGRRRCSAGSTDGVLGEKLI